MTFILATSAVNAMSMVEWKTAHIKMLAFDELYNQVNKILPVSKLKTQPIIPAKPMVV